MGQIETRLIDYLISILLDPKIGNAASVIALLVSLVGFTGTIWMVIASVRAILARAA